MFLALTNFSKKIEKKQHFKITLQSINKKRIYGFKFSKILQIKNVEFS